jgi:hypothetical protein
VRRSVPGRTGRCRDTPTCRCQRKIHPLATRLAPPGKVAAIRTRHAVRRRPGPRASALPRTPSRPGRRPGLALGLTLAGPKATASTSTLTEAPATVGNGANMTFTYSTPAATVSSTNWVGIYQPGQVPGQVGSRRAMSKFIYRPFGPVISRPQLLKGTAAVPGAAVASAVLPASLRKAAARTLAYPTRSSLDDIHHIVIWMQKNRSFDHYFGTFPGARGSTTCRGAPSCRAVTVAGASHAGRGRSEPYGQVNARKIDGECHKNYLSYSIVPVG